MPNTTTSLDSFDFLQLLYMLVEGQKTGLFTVVRDDGNFQCWLEQGQVKQMQFGPVRGVAALTYLLSNPRGRFQFDEGVRHPSPELDSSFDELALEALEDLPEQPLPFEGSARFPAPERLARMNWNADEKRILTRLEAQVPLMDLQDDPVARKLISRLYRLGLIKGRKSRVARLTIVMTHQVRGVVLVDQLILQRWRESLVRLPQLLAVRDAAGHEYQFPLRGGPDLGTELHIPPELLMRTNLRAGTSVLVKPV